MEDQAAFPAGKRRKREASVEMMADDDWISLNAALACMPGIDRHPDVALQLFEAVKAGEIEIACKKWEVAPPHRENEIPPEKRPGLFGKHSSLFWDLAAAELGSNVEVEGTFTRFDPMGGNFDAHIAWGQDDWAKFAVRGVQLARHDVEARFAARQVGISDGAETEDTQVVGGDEKARRKKGNRPLRHDHHSVAAATALRLSQLSADDLRREKVISIVSEMKDHYVRIGKSAPSEKELKEYASKVKRAVTEHQGQARKDE